MRFIFLWIAFNAAYANEILDRQSFTERKLFQRFLNRLIESDELLHGGATWNSAVNRGQIAQGAAIMGLIVPTVIYLMMENPNQLWGDPCYPVVE